jgi:hypothetical protein
MKQEEQEHDTCETRIYKILLQWKNKNKTILWQENIHKIGVE